MNKQPDSLGFLIGDVQRLMRRQFQQQLEGSCLTLAQARALVHIARSEGIRQVELADGLDIQPITLARQLDQLAENGLVERRSDPGIWCISAPSASWGRRRRTRSATPSRSCAPTSLIPDFSF